MPSPLRPLFLIASTVAVLSTLLPAQAPTWTESPRIDATPPGLGSTTYDAARQRLVTITATQIVECDRAAFRVAAAGPGLLYTAVTFDTWRQQTVSFGGSAIFFTDGTTRLWNGVSTTIATPATSPPARQRAAMAFDPVRGRAVLFGGRDALSNQLGDTWEWDGMTWQPVATGGPPPRDSHAMAFDPARGVTVLFGGIGATFLGDTWEWDGVAWMQSTDGPNSGVPSVLAYDEARQRCVLLGYDPTPPTCSTWERVGTTWTLREALSPMQVAQSGGAFDAVLGRVVTTGPDPANPGTYVFWAWNGTTWTPVIDDDDPPLVDGAAVAPCAVNRSMLRFGADQTLSAGHDATFEWRGGDWRRVPTVTHPPGLIDVALAAEPGGTNLLFGGRNAAGAAQAATWRYLGNDWQLLNTTVAPSARSQHGMVLDSVRGRVVLFGGVSGATLLGDTWEWDGFAWTQRFPAQSPPARANPAMAFDAVNGATLLFGGGQRTGPAMADLWSWDGATWQPHVTAFAPTARARAQFAWDPVRQRAVLAGGFAQQLFGLAAVGGTYEWDGALWTQLTGPQPPVSMKDLGTFDEATGRFVMHTSGFGPVAVWQYGVPTIGATVARGAGCAGGTGLPQLVAPNLPELGNPHFSMRLASLLPGAPAVLGVGPGPASVPLGNGCTLLVGQPQLLATLTDAAGVARFVLPLPSSAALHGATFSCQGAGIDAQGPFANLAALSSAVDVTVD
ncbi:MAG: kelch repeat-containing protein [Planctomycetota bacterium]